MSAISKIFNEEAKKQITEAIKAAELNTSGEIRVHVESKCSGDPYMRAAYIFSSLNMFDTKERNAVLIYLAVKSKKFAIIGDSGINEKVTPDFWNDTKNMMAAKFSEGKFAEGIAAAVANVGEKLKTYFIYQEDDVNEQSDEISFGD